MVVESDDKTNPRLKLYIKGEVLVDLDFAKSSVYFRRAKIGVTSTKSVDILLKDPKSIKFGKPEINCDGLQAKVVKKKGNNKDKLAYALELKYTPQKAGRQHGNLVLPLLNKDKKLHLNISAKVEGDIVLRPERLSLWKNMPDTVVNEVVVKSDTARFHVLKAFDSSGRMDPEVITVQKGKHYVVKVKLTDKGKKETRSFTSKIRITTDFKKQPELEFNVFYSPHQRKASIRQGGVINTSKNAVLQKVKFKQLQDKAATTKKK